MKNNSIKKIRIPINSFVLGLLLAVFTAYLFPDLGAKNGLLHTEITTKIGVVLIFLLQGMQLPSERILKDLLEWRLHLFVQCFNFIIIPILVVLLLMVSDGYLPPDLRIGYLYLAILPTTISTAVVFSGMVSGNQTGAIFNAALSNILAVFIVPSWTAWHLSVTAGVNVPITPLLLKLSLLLILPFFSGQILRPLVRNWAESNKLLIRRISTGIILFILFSAFANSGVPMAISIFAAASLNSTDSLPELGIVLLPLMFYHPLQLFIGGLIVGHFSKKQG